MSDQGEVRSDPGEPAQLVEPIFQWKTFDRFSGGQVASAHCVDHKTSVGPGMKPAAHVHRLEPRDLAMFDIGPALIDLVPPKAVTGDEPAAAADLVDTGSTK
ncbi:hypothetical protein [Marimonas arenosa]|uniref:Uncharacterized protein n=1 Tax=Marimonas arenosa TaxID=1795305 RepID=A0AAE3WGF5_9RHOB|nr:hypothetical protein [Marimonas arenosa]MDQ2091307.1 hypothetical protein [Marimonas arenosa]